VRDDSALLAWLELEREAVWVYPLIGARAPQLAAAARTSWSAHREVRDRLVTAVATDTTRARASYAVPDLTDPDTARTFAQGLERRIQAACAAAVAAAEPAQRALPLHGLRTAALAELAWGAPPTAFPGLA